MRNHQVLISEDGDPGDGMQVLRMQEAGKLRQIRNIVVVLSGQWVLERDVNAAVTVLYVEDNRVAAQLPPAADDANAISLPAISPVR